MINGSVVIHLKIKMKNKIEKKEKKNEDKM